MISILTNSIRSLSIITRTKTVCLSISQETLKHVLGKNFKEVLTQNFIKMAFEKSRILKNLNPLLIAETFNTFSIEKYDRFEVVLPIRYVTNSHLIIIIEGDLILVIIFNLITYILLIIYLNRTELINILLLKEKYYLKMTYLDIILNFQINKIICKY